MGKKTTVAIAHSDADLAKSPLEYTLYGAGCGRADREVSKCRGNPDTRLTDRSQAIHAGRGLRCGALDCGEVVVQGVQVIVHRSDPGRQRILQGELHLAPAKIMNLGALKGKSMYLHRLLHHRS